MLENIKIFQNFFIIKQNLEKVTCHEKSDNFQIKFFKLKNHKSFSFLLFVKNLKLKLKNCLVTMTKL